MKIKYNGREISVQVKGNWVEDLVINRIEYVDNSKEEVSEEVYTYVMDNHYDELAQNWLENRTDEINRQIEAHEESQANFDDFINDEELMSRKG
jgi:hypothetical protein